MNPADFGLPDGFRHYAGDPAEDRIGPFFYRPADGYVEAAIKLEAHHCNAFGSAHGGVLLTLADYTACLAGMRDEQDAVATVSLNADFVSAAQSGMLLIGTGRCTRPGKRTLFTQVEIRSGETVVMTASAVLHRLS